MQSLTSEGYPAEVPFTARAASLTVSALAKAGHGKITHHSGTVTSLERRGVTHILRMWVPIEAETPALFHRQGSR